MIAWFVRNSVAANLLMITILGAGLYMLSQKIPLEVFPSFESDIVTVEISLRGGTPEDVEKSVSIRVEEAVQDLEGIKKISSTSSEGSSKVSLEIDSGYSPQQLAAEIKSRVDAINSFPGDAERPVISVAKRTHEVMTVTLASKYGEKETREYGQTIRDELLSLPSVTQIVTHGIRNYEITIEVPQDRLRQYDLNLSDVVGAIQESSLDVSSGNLRSSGGDILLRSTGQAYSRDQFEAILVKTARDGSALRLGDIAVITDGFEEVPVRARYNGKNAMFFEIKRVGDQNAIEISEQVRAYLDEKKADLPQGYELSFWDDDSEIIKSRLSTLANSAIQGSVLVLLLLTLFLRPAIAFWVFIGIPVSFMGAFLFMPLFGVSLNVLSLFAFILVLGIVVDDAIVTGENIYTHLKRGRETGEQAVINGTLEVSKPVTFGVLTTIAAFLPLAAFEGHRAPMFTQIPVIVAPVLLFSLIESKLVLPSHLKHLKLRRQKSGTNPLSRFQQRFADGFEQAVLRFYQPVLRVALKNKLATLLSFLSILLIMIALILSGWMKFTFFPRIQRDTISVTLVMPAGTPFEVTNRYIDMMAGNVERLRAKYVEPASGESLILNVQSVAGNDGSANVGEISFETIPSQDRTLAVTSQQLANEWRRMNGDIPGAEALAYRSEFGRGGSPVDIQLAGNSLAVLEEMAGRIKEHLAGYPTVFDITDSLSDGKQELRIELTEQGRALGLSRIRIANQVRSAYFGAEAQRFQRGRDDIRVMVRLPLSERASVSGLRAMLIDTPEGGRVPLSHVAELIPGKGASEIKRQDLFRTVNITADVEKDNTNMTIVNGNIVAFMDKMVGEYQGVSYTLEGEAKEQSESFSSLTWSLLGVLFAIYVLLAIPFGSYAQPLIVMSIIPFGAVGAILGHWIMGSNLTLLSLMGLLALTGVVVNDSLVLVDYINKQRKHGCDLMEAVLSAGAARFRPVMLTSLTTFIGLLPLLFEKSIQAQFLIPMATSLGFGILFATIITLVLIPVNYVLLDNVTRFLRDLYRPTAERAEPASPV